MSSKIKTFDIVLPLIPLMLLVVSIAVIYSLVFSTNESGLVMKQAFCALLGFVTMIVASFVDYRFFRGTSWIFYLIAIILLLYVDFFGSTAKGATRWIDLGFFRLQPSELAKISLSLTFSSFFSQRIGKLRWADIIVSFLILLPPLVLVLKEPDLGTALVLCFIYGALLFLAKPNKIQLTVLLTGLVLMITIFMLAAFNKPPFSGLLHEYQRNRVMTFIDPNLDPYGKGYNVKQAQIAIGAGGLLGKGLGKGTQSQLRFLPEPHTDFIFSGISESFGFLGTSIFLGLFAFLIIRILNIAHLARDNFGMFLSFSVAAMFLFQVLVNVGMNLGLAPVTGIPLPFSSYGGTAVIVYLFLIGLIESVFIRHKKITF